MFTKKLFWVSLLILLVIPSFFSIIRSGYFPMQDDQHIFRLFEMNKCFADGQIPCRWIPDGGYGYGYPAFNFYPPLIYYLGSGLHYLGFQYIDAVKIIIALGFVAGAIGIFVLASEFFGAFPAFVAGILYTYAPFKAQEIYVRGALSEFWAEVFFPLILWSLYRLIRVGGRKYIILTAIFTGGLFLTHNILAFLFIPVILAWTGYWTIVSGNKKAAILNSIWGILMGLGLAAFFVLPVIFERQYVHIETLLGGYFDYRAHFVTIKELFFSNNWGYGSSVLGPNDDLSLSTGIVHWVLGLVAFIAAFVTFRKNRKISLMILGGIAVEVVVLFLMHQKSSFIWQVIKPLAVLQFPWRLLALSVFILSFIAAFAVESAGKLKYPLGILAVMAIAVMHLGFFAPKVWTTDSDSRELTGAKWDRQLTSSIFDYLPIYAKFPPDSPAPETPELLRGDADFENYYKGSSFQEGTIKAGEDSRVRLPLFDFPGMTVTLNEQKVPHHNNDCSGEKFCLGLITFDIPKGDYKFKVELKDTPVRSAGNVISVLSAAAVILLALQKNGKIYKK